MDASTQSDGGTCTQGCVNGACVDDVCHCAKGYRGTACDLHARSCKEILDTTPTAETGVYAVDPDGDVTEVNVYCDMTTDGGGWTKIHQYKDAAYTPTPDAQGIIATSSIDGFAKLSDATINAIGGTTAEYRLMGDLSPYHFFVRPPTSHLFSDTESAWGLIVTEHVSACHATNRSSCVFADLDTTNVSLDSWILNQEPDLDNCDRIFVDYPHSGDTRMPSCFTVAGSQRCVSSGASCVDAQLNLGWKMIPNFTLWKREIVAN